MERSDRSEWGRLNAGQGYGPLATDVGRALFAVKWGEHVGNVLFHIIESSWRWGQPRVKDHAGNWPNPTPCPLRCGELARLWEVAIQRVCEARDWLVAARVIFETEAGFLVNKDAHQWADPKSGKPLLRPAMLVYAASARERNPSKRGRASVTRQRDTDSRPGVSATHAPASPELTRQRDPDSRPGVTDHRLCDGGKGEYEARVAPASENQKMGREEERDDFVVKTREDDDAGATRRELAREVGRWAGSLPGREMEHLGGWAQGLAEGQYPPEWVREAILIADAEGPSKFRPFVLRILRGWEAAGKPDLAEDERARRAAREPAPAPDAPPRRRSATQEKIDRLQAKFAAEAERREREAAGRAEETPRA